MNKWLYGNGQGYYDITNGEDMLSKLQVKGILSCRNKQIIYKWSWDEDLRYHVQMDGFYVMEVHIIFVTAS